MVVVRAVEVGVDFFVAEKLVVVFIGFLIALLNDEVQLVGNVFFCLLALVFITMLPFLGDIIIGEAIALLLLVSFGA